MKKAKPRRSREYPQVERVFSTNFMDNLLASSIKTFTPVVDMRRIEKRYLKMFKRRNAALERAKAAERENRILKARAEAKIKACDLQVIADIGFPATAERVANTLMAAKGTTISEFLEEFKDDPGAQEAIARGREAVSSLLERGE